MGRKLEALVIARFVFALPLVVSAAADARPASAAAGTATVGRSVPTTGLDLTWVQTSPVLRHGDEGAAVTEWQTLMARWLAANPIADPWHFSIDGVFGPITDGVTRSFQFAQNLPIDGIVGPVTRAAYLSAPSLAETRSDLASADTLLARGMSDPEVATWQADLNAWFAAAGDAQRVAVDGIFGSETDEATREFQASHDVTVDGLVGTETRAELRSAPAIATRDGIVQPSPKALAPPDSATPAAGICPLADGDVVTLVLERDAPSPRCVAVAGDQRLELVNGTTAGTVFFGGIRINLATAATVQLDQPFGAFLAPGVHRVQAEQYAGSGPEVWLRAS